MARKRKGKAPEPDPEHLDNLGATQDDDAIRAELDHIDAEGAGIDEDVKDIFQEGQQLDFGRQDLARKLKNYTDRDPDLAGGDVDASWEYADVGEETVGGQNPTPDQSVVEEDGEAVGLTYQDNEPLGVDDKVGARDRDPWELNPASAPDFGERVNEEFNAPLENLGITPANKTGRKPRQEEKTQNQPTRSPRSRAPSATAMRVAGKGTAAARRAKRNRANTSRSAKSRSTGRRTAKGTSKSRRSAPARARGTRR